MESKIYHERITNLCTQSIPKRIGAYVITHTLDYVHAEKYVGVATKNLYNRICGHCDKEIIYIDLYITDDISLAESLERILMELVRPATNKVISSLSDNDKEIMKELLKDTKIKEYTLNNTIKIGCRYLKCVSRKIILGKYITLSGEWKTLSVHEEIYMRLRNKQNELIEKNNDINIPLSYVTESALLIGIDNIVE